MRHILIFMWCLVLLVGQPIEAQIVETPDNPNKLLAYAARNFGEPTALQLYDPATGGVRTLVEDIEFYMSFPFSSDGRIVYAPAAGGLYMVNALSDEPSPIQITTSDAYSVSWSRDERYLVFAASEKEVNTQIYLWDGQEGINITPNDRTPPIQSYHASWSFDGRLALEVNYGWSSLDKAREIYIWDGRATTNLSQNPNGADQNPTWSRDGRLAFLSERDGEYDILIWDGISDRFTKVAPAHRHNSTSAPRWTYDNQLIVSSYYNQKYLWNGETSRTIHQNPTLHYRFADPRWAFSAYFSPELLPDHQDVDGNPLLDVDGNPIPKSTSGPYPLFCRPSWVLALWNGGKSIELAQGSEVRAEWQGERGTYCSSG